MTATNPSMLDALMAQDGSTVTRDVGAGRRISRYGTLTLDGGTVAYAKSGTGAADGCAKILISVTDDTTLTVLATGAYEGDELSLRVHADAGKTLELSTPGVGVLAYVEDGETRVLDLEYNGNAWLLWRNLDMTVPT